MDDSFDLNLLRVLDALARTRSVTQAALALGMSQSGFSTALARLRRQVDDALFVRTPEGMAPTPRAQRMVEAAQAILARVAEGILDKPVFDPAATRTGFHLAMTDVAEIVYLPRLLRHLTEHAPHAHVTSSSMQPEALLAAMTAGQVDLAIGYFPDLGTSAFFKQRLYTHTFACLMRRGHPLEHRLTEAAYAASGHAVVASPARSNALFEEALARRGIQRRVVLRTPHHLSLPAIVAETDLLATVPLAVGTRFAAAGDLALVALPFTPPAFAVQQHWHRLVHKDARNRWLRQQMAALFMAASAEWQGVESALYGQPARARAAPRKARPPAKASAKPPAKPSVGRDANRRRQAAQ